VGSEPNKEFIRRTTGARELLRATAAADEAEEGPVVEDVLVVTFEGVLHAPMVAHAVTAVCFLCGVDGSFALDRGKTVDGQFEPAAFGSHAATGLGQLGDVRRAAGRLREYCSKGDTSESRTGDSISMEPIDCSRIVSRSKLLYASRGSLTLILVSLRWSTINAIHSPAVKMKLTTSAAVLPAVNPVPCCTLLA